MKYSKLIIYTDGGARGNPGPAGIGAVICDSEDNKIMEISEYIGETTNNQAEYRAVYEAILGAKKLGAYELEFNLDSELVVNQLSGNFKIKNKGLAPMFVKIHNEALSFKKVTFKYIPREKNRLADKLVNQALDRAGK